MKTIEGPAIFLAQFAGDAPPFNSLDAIAGWAAELGFRGVQKAPEIAYCLSSASLPRWQKPALIQLVRDSVRPVSCFCLLLPRQHGFLAA